MQQLARSERRRNEDQASRLTIGDLLHLRCSFFDNTFSKPNGTARVYQLFDHSLGGEPTQKGKTSKGLDRLLQKHITEHDKDAAYNKLKEMQIALTPSAIFGVRRTYDYAEILHPLVIVDIDDVNTSEYLDKLKRFPWIIAAAESVSRRGVYALVYIKDPSLFKEHFLALRTYYFPEADDLKDSTRLRYVSYGRSWTRDDRDYAVPFEELIAIPHDEATEVRQLKPTTKHDNEEGLKKALMGIRTIEESGGLHPWTISAAARCNRDGLSLSFACPAVWDTIKDQSVVRDTSRYTYDRFAHDFHSIYNLYKHEHNIQTKVVISREKVFRFNQEIYDKSPRILQDLVDLVDQNEEKEVVYFTSIVMLGLLFPNTCFQYFNNYYYPNLFGYILGEAASFKGKAKIVREALKPYQKYVDDEYQFLQKKKQDTINYNKSVKAGDDKASIDKVPDLNFLFDGNTSSAALLQMMQDSPVVALFETEGDTITKTWKTDWGNYSDIMRKSFEHESVFSVKKHTTENLLRIRVEKPKLSALVTSTENQMRKVLSADETENGLMSRFLFYIVHNDRTWYNGFESNTQRNIGKILTDRLPTSRWFESLYARDKVYEISNDARAIHQSYFNQVNDSWPSDLGHIIALVRRAGTTTVRLAMMFEELFALDNPESWRDIGGPRSRHHTIGASSMSLSIEVMKILLQHLFVAWQITYKEQDNKPTNVQDSDVRKAVLDVLSKGGSRGYKTVAKELGISREAARYHVRAIRAEQDRGVTGG